MKSLKISVSILLSFFAFAFFITLGRACQPDENPTAPKVCVYKISYVGINQKTGDEIEIDAAMYDPNGNYPNTYVIGEGAKIDDLRGKMTYNEDFGLWTGQEVDDSNDSRKSYAFYGWYTDKALTKAFDGEISCRESGNVTLYAKISVSRWTNNH